MKLDPHDYPSDGMVLLRPYRPGDDVETHAMAVESLEMLRPWMSWAHDNYRIEETRTYIQAVQEAWEQDRFYSFVITSAVDGTLLGGCGLNHINLAYRLANLGYWVRQSRRGQGIAPRAARLLARWGIQKLGLLRAEIVVAVDNTASLRVAAKCGAHREGVLHNRIIVGDRVYDAVMHSLTPQDFGLQTGMRISVRQEQAKKYGPGD